MMSVPSLGENEQICIFLERGALITKYYMKKRPEKKCLTLRRETRQLLVNPISAAAISSASSSSTSRNNYEFALELREVKEIRFGKNSKDFDKWDKVDSQKCFVLQYGSEFKLKSFSVVAHSEKECEMWIKGLKYMVNDTIHSPYPLQVEIWIRKEFYAMENTNKA
jgi:phosphatidylinositol phospholipase C, gamma-1